MTCEIKHSPSCGVARLVIAHDCDACHAALEDKLRAAGDARYRAAHGTEPGPAWDCFWDDRGSRLLMHHHRHNPHLSIEELYDRLDVFSGRFPEIAAPSPLRRMFRASLARFLGEPITVTATDVKRPWFRR